jgi:hypothetical protein
MKRVGRGFQPEVLNFDVLVDVMETGCYSKLYKEPLNNL